MEESLEHLPLDRIEAACRRETEHFLRHGESDGQFCLEIFRRALVLATRSGDSAHPAYEDPAAGELLIKIYTEFIKANINRAALPDIPIDDVVQQSWLRFWRAAGNGLSFNTLPAALRYLQFATISALQDMRRWNRDQARYASLQHLLETSNNNVAVDQTSDPFVPLVKQRFRDRIREILTDPLEYRIYWMRYGLLLKPQEIALILRGEGIQIKGRLPMPRTVADVLERAFRRIAADREIRDLLQGD